MGYMRFWTLDRQNLELLRLILVVGFICIQFRYWIFQAFKSTINNLLKVYFWAIFNPYLDLAIPPPLLICGNSKWTPCSAWIVLLYRQVRDDCPSLSLNQFQWSPDPYVRSSQSEV